MAELNWYHVIMHPLIGVRITAEDPETAAREAREAILGMLISMPAQFTDVGFSPDDPWFVRDPRTRDKVAEGVDNDLDPR